MQSNSDKKSKRIAPLACAAVILVFLGVILGVLLFPLLDIGSEGSAAVVILVLYALVILAMMVGLLIALRQRLREIDGGEEDDASQY